MINKVSKCFELTHKEYLYPVLRLGRIIISARKKVTKIKPNQNLIPKDKFFFIFLVQNFFKCFIKEHTSNSHMV